MGCSSIAGQQQRVQQLLYVQHQKPRLLGSQLLLHLHVTDKGLLQRCPQHLIKEGSSNKSPE
jgi:hypothetical protein